MKLSTSRPADGYALAEWAPVVLLTLIALAIRLPGLDTGLWWDELRTLVDSVRSPLYSIITVFPGDNQHSLFSVLAHVSVRLFGESAWTVRLPAVLAGVLSVPVLYALAREITSRTEALLAALLLTVSYHHVWFSQSARGYTLLALLTLVSTWLLVRGLRGGRSSDFAWYGVAAALGAYTHLTMVFVVVAHTLLCAPLLVVRNGNAHAYDRRRGLLLAFGCAGLLTLLLYAPVMFEVQEVVPKEPMRTATPRRALLELLRGMQIGLGSIAGVAAVGGLAGLGLWSYWRQDRFIAGMFVLPGVITLAATVALQRPVRPRFVFFLAGFALLFVVRGAIELGAVIHRRFRWSGDGHRVGIAIASLIAIMSAASLTTNYALPKQDYEGPMRLIDAQRAADEPVLTAGGAKYPYQAYFRRPWLRADSLADVQRARASGRAVWMIYTLQRYIESQTPDLMQLLESECLDKRVFRGTVQDGDVTVCAFPARQRARSGAP